MKKLLFTDSFLLDWKDPDIYWMGNRAGGKHTTRLLEILRDNFLIQVSDESMGVGAHLDLIRTNSMNEWEMW